MKLHLLKKTWISVLSKILRRVFPVNSFRFIKGRDVNTQLTFFFSSTDIAFASLRKMALPHKSSLSDVNWWYFHLRKAHAAKEHSRSVQLQAASNKGFTNKKKKKENEKLFVETDIIWSHLRLNFFFVFLINFIIYKNYYFKRSMSTFSTQSLTDWMICRTRWAGTSKSGVRRRGLACETIISSSWLMVWGSLGRFVRGFLCRSQRNLTQLDSYKINFILIT